LIEELTDDPKKTAKEALLSNLALAIAKLIAALLTGSIGLMAETIHSFSDSINQVLILIGIKKSKRPADHNHPFGYGKERFLYPFLVATLLFSVSGIFSAQFGFFPILRNSYEPVRNVEVGYVVLLAAVIIEGKSLWTALSSIKKTLRQRQKKVTMKAMLKEFKEHKEPIAMTVLTEDSIAVFAAAVTAFGIYLSKTSGHGIYDAASAVIVGGSLMGFAFFLAREFKDLLIGMAISKQELENMIRNIKEIPEVEKVITIKTMHLSTDDILITADLVLAEELDKEEIMTITQKIENKIKHIVPYADKSKIYVKFIGNSISQDNLREYKNKAARNQADLI
jgi:cation diffusion facilitator family transporter